jgi:type IX secretion system PorP/SprF family membrane protein
MKNQSTHIQSTRGLLLLCLLVVGRTSAQDGQLSQYDAAPVVLNPALTGMYETADFRMSSSARSQWSSLSTSMLSTVFAYDMSFQRRHGLGSYINNYDMAGVMNTFQAGFAWAYNVSDKLADHTLSAGVNLGLIYKKVNDQELLWDLQYNDGFFDDDLPNGEIVQRWARWMPEVSLGVAYRSADRKKKVNPYGNFALFHITTPNESLTRTQDSPLHIRYMVNGGARIEASEQLTLEPMGIFMRQGADQQVHLSLLGELALASSVYRAMLGGSYRFGDAVVAHAGLKHKNSMYRFSYDVNVSPLRSYTNSNGAFELSIIYYATHSGRDRKTMGRMF